MEVACNGTWKIVIVESLNIQTKNGLEIYNIFLQNHSHQFMKFYDSTSTLIVVEYNKLNPNKTI